MNRNVGLDLVLSATVEDLKHVQDWRIRKVEGSHLSPVAQGGRASCDDDTVLDRLGAARKNSPGGLLMVIVLVIARISGFFYFNFKAMSLATGASGLMKHGLFYTFGQPFYSIWALYYVLLGYKACFIVYLMTLAQLSVDRHERK